MNRCKEQINLYEQKLAKIKAYKEQFANLDANKAVVRELLDKTGERKFVKTKLDQYANTFLSDKTTYILSYYL